MEGSGYSGYKTHTSPRIYCFAIRYLCLRLSQVMQLFFCNGYRRNFRPPGLKASLMLFMVIQLLIAACAPVVPDLVSERTDRDMDADRNLVAYHRRLASNVLQQLEAQDLLYEDKEARLIVDRVLARLLLQAARSSINVVFTRLPGENALALANDTILIHQSLLATVASEPQLAFLLAHEISHLNLNHAWSNTRSSLQTRFDRHAFGREQEIEADQYAARMLVQAGYDLVDASGFFTQLANYPVAYPGSEQTRTHPQLAQRKQSLMDARAFTLAANYRAGSDFGQSRDLGKQFDRFRVRQLVRSIQNKTVEPDLPGALVQLAELEAMTGSQDQTKCLRANIYTAIGADFQAARSAMREIVSGDYADDSGDNLQGIVNPQLPVSGFFQDQAEALYREILTRSPRLSHSLEANNCASRGLEALLNQR